LHRSGAGIAPALSNMQVIRWVTLLTKNKPSYFDFKGVFQGGWYEIIPYFLVKISGQKMRQMRQEIDKKGKGRKSDGSDKISLKRRAENVTDETGNR